MNSREHERKMGYFSLLVLLGAVCSCNCVQDDGISVESHGGNYLEKFNTLIAKGKNELREVNELHWNYSRKISALVNELEQAKQNFQRISSFFHDDNHENIGEDMTQYLVNTKTMLDEVDTCIRNKQWFIKTVIDSTPESLQKHYKNLTQKKADCFGQGHDSGLDYVCSTDPTVFLYEIDEGIKSTQPYVRSQWARIMDNSPFCTINSVGGLVTQSREELKDLFNEIQTRALKLSEDDNRMSLDKHDRDQNQNDNDETCSIPSETVLKIIEEQFENAKEEIIKLSGVNDECLLENTQNALE